MFESCLDKQRQLKETFLACTSEEDKYHKIIELGRQQPSFSSEYKTTDNLVKGCQSQMYLRSYGDKDKVTFESASDALISAGLAALLTQVYSGESPETVIKCPPTYLEELGISASLTPSRANGLYSVHLRMKQDALKLLMDGQKNS